VRAHIDSRMSKVGLPAGRNPTSGDVLYDADEVEFLKAIERYKRERRRPFPTWVEVLDVLKGLGWRRVAEPGPPPRPPAE